jgi:hypothetical protein
VVIAASGKRASPSVSGTCWQNVTLYDLHYRATCQLLSQHGLTWNDLPTFFAAIEPGGAADSSNDAATGATAPAAARPEPDVLAVVLRLIEEHIAVTAEERLAVGTA